MFPGLAEMAASLGTYHYIERICPSQIQSELQPRSGTRETLYKRYILLRDIQKKRKKTRRALNKKGLSIACYICIVN